MLPWKCWQNRDTRLISAKRLSFSKTEKRTKVYFAHPYSSFERGSNENANRLIRRFLLKGSTFDKLRQRDVQKLAYWMNKNPRKLFGGKSAKDKANEVGLDFYPAKP